MGKGNKVRKREVKKPKQDKKQKAVTRAVNTTPPASPRPAAAVPPPAGR